MGKLILTCGHEDHKKPFGWEVYEESLIVAPIKGLSIKHYCTECLIKMLQDRPEKIYLNYNEAREEVYGQT